MTHHAVVLPRSDSRTSPVGSVGRQQSPLFDL